MRDGIAERFEFLVGRFQLRRALLQVFVQSLDFLLVLLALGHVADRGTDQQSTLSLQRTQADLDRKLTSILAAAEEFQANAHRTCRMLNVIPLAVFGMFFAKSLRYQELDRLTN